MARTSTVQHNGKSKSRHTRARCIDRAWLWAASDFSMTRKERSKMTDNDVEKGYSTGGGNASNVSL